MDPVEFARLQTGLVWVFWPILHWFAALFAASGFISGVLVIFMGLFRWMTRK